MSSIILVSETLLSLVAGPFLPGVPPVLLTGVPRGEGTLSFGVEVAVASSVDGTRGELVATVPTAGFLVGLAATPGDLRSAPGEEWGDILRRPLFMAMAKPARGFARPMPKRARTYENKYKRRACQLAHM